MAHSTTGGTNDFKKTIIVEFQAHEDAAVAKPKIKVDMLTRED
jgi:hypothetical protein